MSTKNSMTAAVKNTKEAAEKIEALKVEQSMDKALENTKEYSKKHDYKLASHNTMSYLPPRKWYFKLLAFTAQCQSKTIQEQYAKYGVKLFDLRFRFNKKGEVHFAHGAVEYTGSKAFIFGILEYLNSLKDITVIVRYENKEGEFEEEFKEWCKYLETTFTKVKWTGGTNKWRGKLVYKFKRPFPSVEDKYSSCNTNVPGKPVTGTILDDLCPIWYAKKNNRINKMNGTKKDYLMIDFVEI